MLLRILLRNANVPASCGSSLQCATHKIKISRGKNLALLNVKEGGQI